MKFLDFPVRNWQFTLVVFAMVAALGLASWVAIPKGEDPPLNFPTFTVVAVYPGASPTDLERLVVKPAEDRVHALENIKQIKSNIQDGVATISVEFEADQDPEKRYDEVVREMNALRPELPEELVRFTVEKTTTEDVAIAQLALVSEAAPYRVLDSLADRLEDRLSSLTGVRRVERWGVPEKRVDVSLDLGRLARLNLPPGLVLQAIAGESADLPAGRVEAGSRAFNVKSSGSYETLAQISGTVVRSSGGQLVRVGDIAEVRWGYADSTYQARYNGKRAVFVTVTGQGTQNVSVVRDRVWAELDRFVTELPPDVTLARGFDQAANVSHRLARLGTDFAIAIALVLLTLLPLGLRAASIVMVSIPLSLAIGLTLLRFAGFTVNQLSIVGSVIALGLLVDDSIVVVENITRFLRAGRSRLEAAVEATRQIAVAVLGATATLVLAFVPLLLLPGGPGMYIRSMPVAVIFTVLGSLFVSLTIIPWLASRVLPQHAAEGGNRALHAFEGFIHRTYAPLLDRALRRPVVALGVAGAFVVAAGALVPAVGFSLFPKAETAQFYVNVTAPEGASIEATGAAARYAESVILGRPEARAAFTSVGHDNPRIYYNVVPRRDNPAVGQLFVVLERYDPKRTPAMLDSLRATFAAYPAARIELREFENGPPVDAPIAIRVRGPDLDTLRTYAARVEEALLTTPGTQYVDNPVRLDRTDLRVVIDRAKAGLLGVSPLEIDRTLRLGLAGVEGGVLREADGEARDVVVRLADRPRPSPETLDRIYFASSAGRLTPVRQVADVRFEAGVPEIRRVDRERS
ncbi:MAG TPA: efflux RND transporter permease subunit, partial [Gemmatimonadales bacterium]|nr:efflux RND transporter permease subunit [Gemmatimonadales bacterium]